MGDTNSQDTSAWFMARLGNALDAYVDRNIYGNGQFAVDAGQQYGVDANGNVYQLGKTNQQLTAVVANNAAQPSGMTLLLIGAVVLLVVMEGK